MTMCAVQSARIKAAANELIQLLHSHSIQLTGCDNCAVIEHHSFHTAPVPTPPSPATPRWLDLNCNGGTHQIYVGQTERFHHADKRESKTSPVHLEPRIDNHLLKIVTILTDYIFERILP